MFSILITGASGFVGKNLISYLGDRYYITKYSKGSKINIQEDTVIHLAGKAHDLKNASLETEYYSVNTDLTKEVFNAFLPDPLCNKHRHVNFEFSKSEVILSNSTLN